MDARNRPEYELEEIEVYDFLQARRQAYLGNENNYSFIAGTKGYKVNQKIEYK